MPKLQSILPLLFCLAISLQGIVGGSVSASSCPMEKSDSMEQMHIPDMKRQTVDAADHGCCRHDTEGNAGKACKMGLGCLVSVQYPAVVFMSLHVPVGPTTQFPPLVVPVLSFDASSVWRPPARA